MLYRFATKYLALRMSQTYIKDTALTNTGVFLRKFRVKV